jgi:hypothetical protein
MRAAWIIAVRELTDQLTSLRFLIMRALPGLGLLVLYSGVFLAGAFFAFARFDVR